MSDLIEGQTWDIDGWDGMAEWLEVSCGELDVGDVLSIGPSDPVAFEVEVVPNAQFQKLEGEVAWLRLSTTVMDTPLLSDLTSDGLLLDSWHPGNDFDDCTDGFIVSANLRLLADACVTWFRDRHGFEIEDLGCHHDRARSLRG